MNIVEILHNRMCSVRGAISTIISLLVISTVIGPINYRQSSWEAYRQEKIAGYRDDFRIKNNGNHPSDYPTDATVLNSSRLLGEIEAQRNPPGFSWVTFGFPLSWLVFALPFELSYQWKYRFKKAPRQKFKGENWLIFTIHYLFFGGAIYFIAKKTLEWFN